MLDAFAILFEEFLRAFADLKPHEPADRDLIAKLLADLRDVFLHADFGIAFHETLVHEAVGLEKFVQHARQDFLHRLRRLALEPVGLRGNLAFLRDDFGRDLLARNRVRMSRRDLQRDVAHELLEFLLAPSSPALPAPTSTSTPTFAPVWM